MSEQRIEIIAKKRPSSVTQRVLTDAQASGLRVVGVSPSQEKAEEHARLLRTGWVAEAWLRLKRQGAPLPEHDLLIVDDAHKLSDEDLRALIADEPEVKILAYPPTRGGAFLLELVGKHGLRTIA